LAQYRITFRAAAIAYCQSIEAFISGKGVPDAAGRFVKQSPNMLQ